MDWKIAVSTFLIVFLAELGDKTQMTVFARSAQTGAPTSVFVGAATALILSTLLGVLVGAAMGRLPDRLVKGVAGAVFIGFGLWTLWGIKS